MGLKSGILSLVPSNQKRPTSVRMNMKKAMSNTIGTTTRIHQLATIQFEVAMRNFVGQGSAASLPSNTVANRGRTKVIRKMVTEVASVAMTPG